MNSIKLSVAIIAKNEEANIKLNLESIKDIADEIVLIDSGSTDKTLEIAQSYSCKIYHEDWKGFVEQRNIAIQKCNGEWILILDADESLSKEMADNIKQELLNPKYDAYSISRRVDYLGKILKYSWQPDSIVRLLSRKSNPHYTGTLIHETLEYNGSTGKISGWAIHRTYRNLFHHYDKMVSYAKLQAESYYKRGRKFKLLNLLINPITGFIKMYFIRLGFLDGIRGFSAAFGVLFYTLLKYLYLWELENK